LQRPSQILEYIIKSPLLFYNIFKKTSSNFLQSITSKPNSQYLLLEGYHRLKYAERAGINRLPAYFISPWLEGEKMTFERVLQMKQLRNFTESHRQNDGKF
jgi:hypothetical protein